MKIAVISDIHGNMEALEAVYEDIKSQGCELIFALGDYAMAGPEPSKVIKWFIEHEVSDNITMIQGNTDYMIANYSGNIYDELKEKAPVMAEALKDDYKSINTVFRTFLKDLPENKFMEINGVKIQLVHGSPRRNNEDISPDTPMEDVEEMVKDINVDLVVCGHTHIPCGFQTMTKKTVVNVGSVGRPFTDDPKSCYLIVMLENGKFVVEHRFVEYDKEKASKKLLKRKFDGADKLANTLLNPQERHF